MPAITTNDLKTGITLELDNGLFQVVEFQHVKPGKGGAFVRTKLRNVKTGSVFDRTFNAGIRVEQAIINREDMQFLYRDGDDYVFMNNETYDQMNVAPVALGDAADYMVEGMVAQVAFFQGQIISVEIPVAVELTIAETEPGVQGDRVSGARKPATLETGKVVQVPLFVEVGDKIRVDTRSGDYITASDGCAVIQRPDERSDARERALYLLYEAHSKGISPADTIDLQVVEPDALTQELVRGVDEHLAALDEKIAAQGEGLDARPHARARPQRHATRHVRVDRADRRPHGRRPQRGGRAREAVLHRRLGPVRQRRARRHRGRRPRPRLRSDH